MALTATGHQALRWHHVLGSAPAQSSPIALTATDNSTVTLTVHFWSDQTLQYTLTKDGDTVTGTA